MGKRRVVKKQNKNKTKEKRFTAVLQRVDVARFLIGLRPAVLRRPDLID